MAKIDESIALAIKRVCDWMDRSASFDKTRFGYISAVNSSTSYDVVIVS